MTKTNRKDLGEEAIVLLREMFGEGIDFNCTEYYKSNEALTGIALKLPGCTTSIKSDRLSRAALTKMEASGISTSVPNMASVTPSESPNPGITLTPLLFFTFMICCSITFCPHSE